MPQGKRKKSSKKKGHASQPEVSSGTAVSGDNAHPVSDWSSLLESAETRVPLFSTSTNKPKRRTPPRAPAVDRTHESLYVRYKKSTQRFKDELQSMVPAKIFASDSVNAIMEATEYIVEHNMEVSSQLLSDLKLSIRVRERIAEEKYGGGDVGHYLYFIEMLRYCWSLLAPQRKQRTKAVKPSPSSQDQESDSMDTLNNRFGMLSGDENDYESDDDNEEADLPQSLLSRPVETVPKRLTQHDLIHGSDRTDCILFLISLDELMGCNAALFKQLKEASARIQSENLPPTSVVQLLIEASVATNLNIQQVAALEKEFNDEHPHLNTIYRLFACLVLANFTEQLTAIVTKKSPLASKFTEKDAVQFIGDSLECIFRNPHDRYNKKKSMVKDFLKKWQFQDSISQFNPFASVSIEQLFSCVISAGTLEFVMEIEKESYSKKDNLPSKFGMRPHSWLPSANIGTNRSITHTIRLVQGYSNLAHGGFLMSEDVFGVAWCNRKKPVPSIQCEMDGLLMRDIMPALIGVCACGAMKSDYVLNDDVLAGFAQIKAFVNNPERPVSWAVVFTVHTILTGIFETQGSNDTTFLAETARSAYEKFIHQLEWVEKAHSTKSLRRSPCWGNHVNNLHSLLSLLPQTSTKTTRDQVMSAVWNPYCAGMLLAHATYFGNLDGGTFVVNSLPDLRMTLHLYNALIQKQAIQPGQIAFLDSIFTMFKDCQEVWEGKIPTLGKFEDCWFHACKTSHQIEVDLLSTSAQRICHHDFRGRADRGRRTQRRRKKHDPLYQHASRVCDALAAVTGDAPLLSTNLIVLGFYLSQFCIDLLVESGLMAEVDKSIKHFRTTVGMEGADSNFDMLRYQCMAHHFAKILKPLDEGDEWHTFKCAEFMTEYFQKVRLDMVKWFDPFAEEKDETYNRHAAACIGEQKPSPAASNQDVSSFPSSIMQNPDISVEFRRPSGNPYAVDVVMTERLDGPPTSLPSWTSGNWD